MGLKSKSTYIYSIEGKDIINGGSDGYKIKPNKKFKATLDFSLETLQLDEVSRQRGEEIFYLKDGKQYTKAIINLTFKYSIKQFRKYIVDKQNIYVKHDFTGNIEDIKFINGLFVVGDDIMAIQVGQPFSIVKNQFVESLLNKKIKLPKGFGFSAKDEKITFKVKEDKLTTVMGTSEIRRNIYRDGFNTIDDKGNKIHYIRFKRSSGSSREGKCLFIQDDYFKPMMEWSYMGLEPKQNEEIDLAALESYVSLTSSGIIDTIEIDPKSILIIDDYESVFSDDVMVTKTTKIDDIDRLETKLSQEKVEIKNTIWDGQSLLDSSVFGNSPDKNMYWVKGKYANKGMLLLRNRFFKSACFNTNIQKFFKDNDITRIDQLNGKTLAKSIEDIKLITTPSSIKYLKFGSWESFINQCTDTWGVVKHEKPTHYFNGEMVQTHYQLLNTLQLSEGEVKELLKPTLEYIRLLKNNIVVFRKHLGIKIKADIKAGEINSTNDLMFTMLQVNNKFFNSDLFVSFRQDLIDSFIKNVQKGHVLVHGNYSVLFGNGFEMLKATIKDKNHKMAFKGKSLLKVDEVYCTNFPFDNQLLACRSPHVSMSGLWLPKNVDCLEIRKYFNLTKEIICVNAISNNVLNRLSGADFDSDQVLLTDSELLINSAIKNQKYFKVPIYGEKPNKILRYNTLEEKADLDIKTSINLIGEIINFSQVLNSLLWDKVNKGKSCDDQEIQDIYQDICQLDIMSRIEIDSAKKEFTIDNGLELKLLSEKYDIKKPKFLYDISKSKKFKPKAENYKSFNTTMDFLIQVIKREIKKIRAKRRNSKGNPVIALDQLLSKNKDVKVSGADRHQINSLIEHVIKLKIETNNIWASEQLDSEEKYKKANELKNEIISKVEKLKIKEATIKKIIKDFVKNPDKIIHDEPELKLKSIERKMISILFKAHKNTFLKLFKENKDENIAMLIKVNKDQEIPEGAKIYHLYDIDYMCVKQNTQVFSGSVGI